ncbi:MAG: TraB/GumN family protein, partial [Prevotella sp.]|nr:TraB/GumN family protein [Prevotella sp.]
NRNLNWAKLMPAIMGAKPTLFAVGAGHLCGEHGMIQLLRNAGYCVEAVSR